MVVSGQACIHPGPGLPARFAKDPVADRQNEAAVFRDGNELRRRDRPSSGMRPAYQRFRAGNLSRPQIDLRLVVQREFLPFQGAPQTLLDGLPLHGADVHGRLEKLIALAPIFLCLVHRGVRVLDERLRIQAVVGIDAHANAGGDVKIVLVDGMSLRHRLQHSSRRDGSIFRLFHFGKQHDEFIASLPAYRVRAAHAIHQAFCDGLKKFVADRMSQGIVDVFEAIQIQKQHRDFFRVTRRQGDRLADPVVQEHSIGQAGQKVVLGRMGHLQRHRPGRAHVAENDDRSGSLPFTVVDGGDGVFDRNFKSVAPDEDTVRRQVHGSVLPDRHLHRIRDGFATRGVQDSENFGHRPACRFLPATSPSFFPRRD